MSATDNGALGERTVDHFFKQIMLEQIYNTLKNNEFELLSHTIYKHNSKG